MGEKVGLKWASFPLDCVNPHCCPVRPGDAIMPAHYTAHVKWKTPCLSPSPAQDPGFCSQDCSSGTEWPGLELFCSRLYTYKFMQLRSQHRYNALIHFNFCILCKVGAYFILLYMDSQCPRTICWNDYLFPLWFVSVPLSKINWPSTQGFFSGILIVFHCFQYLSLCQYDSVLMTITF
jgi:hypothetical protein